MKLVRVYETADPIRGVLIQGLLGSDGIDVLAKGEGSGPYRMGPVILFVPEDDADRARELIAASEAGTLTIDAGEELGSDVAARTVDD
jgi:putative signal transducing protein